MFNQRSPLGQVEAGRRERLGFESGKIEELRGVLDIDADDSAFVIEINDHAFLNFTRIHAWSRVQIDVKRIRLATVVQLHRR